MESVIVPDVSTPGVKVSCFFLSESLFLLSQLLTFFPFLVICIEYSERLGVIGTVDCVTCRLTWSGKLSRWFTNSVHFVKRKICRRGRRNTGQNDFYRIKTKIKVYTFNYEVELIHFLEMKVVTFSKQVPKFV